MSVASNVRNAKLVADALHLACYPFLFYALRRAKPGKFAVSFNSQMLFFIALVLRYLPVIVDSASVLEVVRFFSGKRSEVTSLDFFVSLYSASSSNVVYVTLLKVLPLILSATAALKSFASEHRGAQDTISFVRVLLPCLVAAIVLHNYVLPTKDPFAVAKSASYMIEAVAVIPQLWVFSKRDFQASRALDLHLLCRGLFRLIYVSAALYKIVRSGKPFQGSWADNLPLLAGCLQVMILSECLSAILRRNFRIVTIVCSSVLLVALNGGSSMLVEACMAVMLLSLFLSVATGGLTFLNVALLSFTAQLYRAGVLSLRLPFSSEL
mmetsp:Transcript_4146/g.9111  ORF Transcript_4146/g.9111 Transcript_4146/m.9111 type:complete len:324 (-) Transcript_4146:128-1099(-)|eukprot:CAMPEP_0180148250 /NCGR_PEP_ID=MMETSP0986-20121125/19859_1 /TAXON_ID=697907 /ORGANISM="non described non described, Strain CCMP2293" /LENGTH=323 /DNA_ID=CAMNT_0022094193 /DNA_START=21 /DNA_END=992 /DNA_ORIENTATION=+